MTINTFTDQLGRKVEIEYPITRIVSLVPSITELLFFLGLQDHISGITDYCVHPKDKVSLIEKVGGTKNPDTKKISNIKPGLIISSAEENNKKHIEQLSKEFPVWVADIGSVADACQMISTIGDIFDRHQISGNLVEDILNGFRSFNKETTIKVAYLIWENPIMTVGSQTYINDILLQMGLINVFSDKARYPKITPEKLADSGAEFILLPSEPFDFNDQHIAQYNKLCPDAKTLLVDGQMFSWYGSRMISAIKYLKKIQNMILMMKKYG